jgi:CheY-like chemotaxis protein/HPt (histidine-containing phosphotransfer) domain-containing protein
MNLMVAKELFKDYGMEVTTALSGIEAIDICGKERFDIIFMDHMMPDMDGIETMKKIRELESGIGKGFTIVALTANAVSGAREMFINEGFDGFVAKPVDSLELERVLKRVLPEDRIVYDESKDIVPVDETADDNDTLAGPKDLFTVLEEAGVDVASGVNYSGGSKDFYVKVLAKYVEEASDKVKLIEEYRKNKDYENYKIQVHAIKSTSKMVGIGSIFDKALALENAAKEADETFINDNHQDLVDSYISIVETISNTM